MSGGVNSKYEELRFSNFYHYIWLFHEHLHVYCLAAVAFLLFFNVDDCKFRTEKMWYDGACINNGMGYSRKQTQGWGVEDMEFPARGIEKIECGNSRGQ